LNYQGYYAIIIERKVRFFWILLIYILEVKMINEIAEKKESEDPQGGLHSLSFVSMAVSNCC